MKRRRCITLVGSNMQVYFKDRMVQMHTKPRLLVSLHLDGQTKIGQLDGSVLTLTGQEQVLWLDGEWREMLLLWRIRIPPQIHNTDWQVHCTCRQTSAHKLWKATHTRTHTPHDWCKISHLPHFQYKKKKTHGCTWSYNHALFLPSVLMQGDEILII